MRKSILEKVGLNMTSLWRHKVPGSNFLVTLFGYWGKLDFSIDMFCYLHQANGVKNVCIPLNTTLN